MIRLEGVLQDGSSAARHPARLEIIETGSVELVNETSGTRELVSTDNLKVSSRLGQLERQLQFSADRIFLTPDNDGVDAALPVLKQGKAGSRLSLLERNLGLALVLGLVLAIGLYFFFDTGIPKGAKVLAFSLPAQTSQYIGRESLTILDDSILEPSTLSEERQQALIDLFRQAMNAEEQALDIQIVFRSGQHIGANALALPSGTIIFTDELVNLAADDRELVAIFGHELGHLKYRHSLRQAMQNSALFVAYSLLTGDVSGAPALAAGIPAVLLQLGYSRDFEREADDYAYDFLLRNGLATQHFAAIMRRLMHVHATDHTHGEDTAEDLKTQSGSDIDDFLSTHPDTEKRIKRFE